MKHNPFSLLTPQQKLRQQQDEYMKEQERIKSAAYTFTKNTIAVKLKNEMENRFIITYIPDSVAERHIKMYMDHVTSLIPDGYVIEYGNENSSRAVKISW